MEMLAWVTPHQRLERSGIQACVHASREQGDYADGTKEAIIRRTER